MELYCLEAKEDHVIFVDVKYPAVAYRIANLRIGENDAVEADISVLAAQNPDVKDTEYPPNPVEHEEEVLKEFLVLLEKQFK